MKTSNKTLGNFVSFGSDPTHFTLNFKYPSSDNPSNMLSLNGMLYDQFLNFINVTATT